MRNKSLFKEKPEANPKEDLANLSILSMDPKWDSLKRCLIRYYDNLKSSSFKLNMSIDSHKYAHSNYNGQGEAIRYIIKLVENAGKLAEKKEKENGSSTTA